MAPQFPNVGDLTQDGSAEYRQLANFVHRSAPCCSYSLWLSVDLEHIAPSCLHDLQVRLTVGVLAECCDRSNLLDGVQRCPESITAPLQAEVHCRPDRTRDVSCVNSGNLLAAPLAIPNCSTSGGCSKFLAMTRPVRMRNKTVLSPVKLGSLLRKKSQCSRSAAMLVARSTS
jgi:hypothetical protein